MARNHKNLLSSPVFYKIGRLVSCLSPTVCVLFCLKRKCFKFVSGVTNVNVVLEIDKFAKFFNRGLSNLGINILILFYRH